jgi:hypothetical protein
MLESIDKIWLVNGWTLRLSTLVTLSELRLFPMLVVMPSKVARYPSAFAWFLDRKYIAVLAGDS